MKIRKVCVILILAIAAANILPTGVSAAALPGMLPTNHYMARNLVLAPGNSSLADGTLPGIVIRQGMPVTLKTFDQFTCFTGNHELVLRIARHDDGFVVGATKPIAVKAPHDGFVFTQPTVWKVLFPTVGWYRHEVIVNGTPIAYYHFIVSFAI